MGDFATPFTPVAAALGGVIIGLSTVILLAANGRLAGISSIIGTMVSLKTGEPRLERAAFLVGLVLGPLAVAAVRGLPDQTLVAHGAELVAAGFCVGAGTIIGSGCTSGHGVCGTARLSPRSLVATATFVLVGALTVYLVRHAL